MRMFSSDEILRESKLICENEIKINNLHLVGKITKDLIDGLHQV
jgi:hypothetical protein